MKAPDIIFVQVATKPIPSITFSEIRECDDDIEYVRKDLVNEMLKTAEDHAYFAGQEKLRETLLEWSKDKREQMKIEAGGCSNMLAAGKFLAFEEIIEKTESL